MATITIFLNDDAFNWLKYSVPRRTHSRSVLDNATRYTDFLQPSLGTNIIRCNEIEARNLRLYVKDGSEVVAEIDKAFKAAGISV